MRLTDRQGTILMVNPAYCRLVGRSSEELVGRLFTDAYAAARSADALRRHQEQFNTGTARPLFTSEVELWDGRRLWFEVGAQFLTVAGEAPLLLGVFRDVTQRVLAEAALRESEQRYRELFETNPHPMWVYDLETLRFLAVNDAAIERYGYTRDEFLRMSLADIRPPEDTPAVMESVRKPGGPFRERSTWRHHWKDGTIRTVEITAHDIQYAGRPARLASAIDITERVRMEEALRASEARFRALVEKSFEAVALTAADGTLLYLSPGYQAISGFKPEEVVGRKGITELTHPDERAALKAQFDAQVAAPGSTVSIACRTLHKDGSWRWIEGRRTNLFDDPAVGAFVTNFRDVTERVQMEEARRASEALFRAVVEKAYDAVALTAADGTLLYVSPSCEAIIGYAPHELVGKKVLNEMTPPEDREALRAKFEAQLNAPGTTVSIAYRLRHRDGTWRWLEGRRTNLLDDPAVGAFLTNLRDVTKQRTAEAALRERTELLRAILANIPAGVFWKDRQSVYLGCNDRFARDFGLSAPDVIIGKADRDLTPDPAEADAFVAIDRQVLDSGEPMLDREQKQTWPGGRAGILLVSKVPLRDASGAVVGVLGIYQDITDRRRLEEQFRQSQKMEAIGRLAGGIAHDFNNLLTVINGYTDILLDSTAANERGYKLLEEVRKAGDRAAGLTKQLLAFGRKQILQKQAVDLGQLVTGLGGMLTRLIGEDVFLTVHGEPNLPRVAADPGQIEQVVMNLAVNARDAMPTGGTLTIETRRAKPSELPNEASRARPHVVLVVADTGTGMTDEVKVRAFEPFFTTKGPGRGTGLGLATVYGIVSQSEGHIEFDTKVGEGTTFRIYLPSTDSTVTQPSRAVKPAAAPRGTETILLVEDDNVVRALALHVLRNSGYNAIDAASGPDALRLIQSRTIDILVTDVVMPGMDGRELADRLRATRPDLRVLYVSGYTDDAIVRHGIEQDAVHFLPKPYSPAALARKVREVLDRVK